MIIKSYEIRKINNHEVNFFLFYGENQGLKEEIIQDNFRKKYFNKTFTYNENDILNNKTNFYDQLLSNSFFEDEKLIIINRATDKILSIIEDLLERNISSLKFVLTSKILEKKSKLRKFFETNTNTVCIPFYEDSNQQLNAIAQNFFKDKKISISQESINVLISRSNNDRINLKNEMSKIESFAKIKKKIDLSEVLKLSNLADNFSISELADYSLLRNKKKALNIINENNFSIEDGILILRIFLSKLKRLLKIHKDIEINKSLETSVSSYKPPIFWKDKEIVKQQINSLTKEDVQNLIIRVNDIELLVKKRPVLSINIISDFILEQSA
tara:strand:+ start:3832 stop:4815 length:984 start_codon:yes stop_codon:yes gene_type:complete